MNAIVSNAAVAAAALSTAGLGVVESNVNAVSAAEAVAATPSPDAKVRVKKTLAERIEALEKRIEADTAKLDELTFERDNAERLASVGNGSVVAVKLGRKFKDKDTTRVVQGVVIATKEEDDGSKLLKVQVGEGFDVEFVTVGLGAVESVIKA